MRLKHFFVAFLFSLFSVVNISGVPKAEVISAGDRGVALEWVREFGEDYTLSEMDGDGNIYLAGVITDGSPWKSIVGSAYNSLYEWNIYLAKFDAAGNRLWTKCLHGNGGSSVEKIVFTTDGNMYAYCGCSCVSEKNKGDNATYYDNKVISEQIPDSLDKFCYYSLLKIDKETGNLLDHVELNGVAYTTITPTFDGGFIYSGEIGDGSNYKLTYVPKFEGLNKTTLKSDLRSNSLADFYVAKISPDFKLDWEFKLEAHNNKEKLQDDVYYNSTYDVGYNALRIIIDHNTMYFVGGIYSDSMDIDPDEEKVAMIMGEKMYSNRDSVTSFIAKYDISGSFPVLLDYVKREPQKELPYERLYYNEGHGIYGINTNPKYDFVVNSDNFIYVTLDSTLSIIQDSSLVSNGGAWMTLDYESPFSYDQKDNLLILNSRNYLNKVPLVVKVPGTSEERSYSAREFPVSCISKYTPSRDSLWTLVVQGAYIYDYHPYAYSGVMYLNCYAVLCQNTNLDVNPAEDKSYIIDATRYLLAKYHETYRIKANQPENGTIMVPDTFAWHGYNYIVKVNAAEGYHVSSVRTAKGDTLEALGNGQYLLKNVTEPTAVTAVIAEGSGIEKVRYKEMTISPNPVTESIRLDARFENCIYSIYSTEGRLVGSGKTQTDLNVSSLPGGIYELLIETQSGDYRGRFVKK